MLAISSVMEESAPNPTTVNATDPRPGFARQMTGALLHALDDDEGDDLVDNLAIAGERQEDVFLPQQIATATGIFAPVEQHGALIDHSVVVVEHVFPADTDEAVLDIAAGRIEAAALHLDGADQAIAQATGIVEDIDDLDASHPVAHLQRIEVTAGRHQASAALAVPIIIEGLGRRPGAAAHFRQFRAARIGAGPGNRKKEAGISPGFRRGWVVSHADIDPISILLNLSLPRRSSQCHGPNRPYDPGPGQIGRDSIGDAARLLSQQHKTIAGATSDLAHQ